MSWRAALVLIVALGCHRAPSLPAGDVAATLIAPTARGDAFDPTSLHGKPTLVMFASITCKYCLATIPRAAAAARAEGGNALIVFVSGNAGSVNSFTTTTKFPFPALVDDGTLKQQYAINAVPYTLVLGADGHAHDALEGEQEESTLRDALIAAR